MDKINIVCPHCLKINAIPKKDTYTKANCGSCKNSLLDTTPMQLDESNFDHVIVNSQIPVIVDFWAPWCGPCKVLGPLLEDLEKNAKGKWILFKINTEEEVQIASINLKIKTPLNSLIKERTKAWFVCVYFIYITDLLFLFFVDFTNYNLLQSSFFRFS